MELILLERIEKLGQMGDVVNVKPGFARNYLLPQRKALRATKANRERFDHERVQLEAVNLERRKEAEAVSVKLEDFSCVLLRQASESAQLYGSVSARDIAEAATKTGVTVDRGQVLLERPIKALGIHKVRIALHPEVIVGIRVNVARSAEEAEAQEAAGAAVAPGLSAEAAAADAEAAMAEGAEGTEGEEDEGETPESADEDASEAGDEAATRADEG